MSLNNSIPVFKLYGENLNWPTRDLLHCESIHSRSSLYEWHIRVHQHADLVQLLYLHKGQAEVEIEGTIHHIEQACIQVVPALCVHGFRFSPGTQGYSLSFSAPLLAQFEQQFGQPLQVLTKALCVPVNDSRSQINTLFRTLQSEYEGEAEARDMMIHSLIGALLVWLNRQNVPELPGGVRIERKRAVIRSFNKLVENHYRDHLPVSHYAGVIGLSSVHLNNLCQEFHGQSALNVINQRLLLEAKRSLHYTSMTISQVSDYLGFSDATYFSRFFRRYVGTTPKAFRRDAEQVIVHF
ncbi:helix-turn-helix domain-containing protein [Enterobacteriaceae bacterium H11S18]|uniref:helix-turn-helix domain-containing protein n=1 Tax=Enterobacteriaceae TaxID=543 RepID=UPI001928367B|nr:MULTISPECIES: helix-turn-helix domain-containing protein [Enterobacteriaceae]MCT4705350.1 helix-turn-helix domain-containing protein [Dryocola clanedunensis]MCT4709722.1 helix-turn-helix domain-containing protein [Dryocola clanedunensis]